jgi:hypothetical protein
MSSRSHLPAMDQEIELQSNKKLEGERQNEINFKKP